MTMPTNLKLTAVIGSLRSKSLTRAVFDQTREALASRGASLTEVTVHDVPLYNGDIEDAGDPTSVIALKRAVERSDGLILFTPEYNGSVPAVTKNVVDWLSRPYGRSALTDTPVGIVAQSPGRGDAKGARAHLAVSVSGNSRFFFPETLGLRQSRAALESDDALDALARWSERFVAFVATSRQLNPTSRLLGA